MNRTKSQTQIPKAIDEKRESVYGLEEGEYSKFSFPGLLLFHFFIPKTPLFDLRERIIRESGREERE